MIKKIRDSALMYATTVVLVFIFLSMTVAQGGDEEQAYYQTDVVAQMAEQMEMLESRIETLEARLAVLEREDVNTTTDATHVQWSEVNSWKPDNPALRSIPPLTQWTTDEVEDYISQILDVSSRETHLHQDAPHIRMLAEVGPDYIGSLLDALGTRSCMANEHLSQAIARLAREEHRELILDYLPFHYQLASIVVMHGWEDDAAETLIQGLYQDDYLSHDWLKATAQFDDPRVDSGMVRYFIHGLNFTTTYRVLSDWSDIDLDAIVAEAWEFRKSGKPCEVTQMAAIAASHGIFDAIETLAQTIRSGHPEDCIVKAASTKLKKLVDDHGLAIEISELILQEPDALHYDPVVKNYWLD